MVHFSLDQYLTEENERKKVTVLNKRNYEEMRTHHLKLTQHLTGHQNTTDSFQSPTAVQKRESGLAVTPATYPRMCNTVTNRIKNTAGYHGA